MTTLLIISHIALSAAAFMIGRSAGYSKCIQDDLDYLTQLNEIIKGGKKDVIQ